MDRKPGHLSKNIDVTSSLIWVKIVGVGNAGVGKTCLIKHFCESRFSNSYQPTVGVDYGFKIQNVQNVDLRVHMWDLSGGAEYLDVRNELYGSTDAVFLVCDVTNPASFESLDIWLREVQKYGPSDIFTCLVANKTDQKAKRQINSNEAKKWAAAHKMKYFETSCQSGENVEAMFNEVLSDVLARRKKVTVAS